jgi:hypothetical protein
MLSRSLIKLTGILSLSLAVGATASAQYGGGSGGSMGTGSTGSSGYGSSSGKAIGIGVGAAAAAAVGIALLVHHHHAAARPEASLIGCTQSGLNGINLKNEKDDQTYMLLSRGTSLQPGERLELKGVVAKENSGTPAFRVQSLVKNYGACGSTAALKEKSAEANNEIAQNAK